MNNLLSYFELIDARMSASDKDLLVQNWLELAQPLARDSMNLKLMEPMALTKHLSFLDSFYC